MTLAEELGVAGHGGMELLADLALQLAGLVHQIAAVSAEQLHMEILGRPRRLDEAEAVDGGAKDGGQVAVVGLVVGIGGLAVLLGGVRVDQADVPAELAAGALHGAMVLAGAFDGDDEVAEVVLGQGLAEAVESGLQSAVSVADLGRLEQWLAVEVGEHVLGATLAAVETEDAEVLGSHRLHARLELPPRLVQQVTLGCPRRLPKRPFSPGKGTAHETPPFG